MVSIHRFIKRLEASSNMIETESQTITTPAPRQSPINSMTLGGKPQYLQFVFHSDAWFMVIVTGLPPTGVIVMIAVRGGS
jgi:hypothetical protein